MSTAMSDLRQAPIAGTLALATPRAHSTGEDITSARHPSLSLVHPPTGCATPVSGVRSLLHPGPPR